MAALPLDLFARPIGRPTTKSKASCLKTVQPPALMVSQIEFQVVPGLAREPKTA